MLRVRPGVLLVRASLAPTSELITLDFPTLERPRKAISGTPGEGKWVKSLAESMNRARIRIRTVSSVWAAHGKGRRKNKFIAKSGKCVWGGHRPSGTYPSGSFLGKRVVFVSKPGGCIIITRGRFLYESVAGARKRAT